MIIIRTENGFIKTVNPITYTKNIKSALRFNNAREYNKYLKQISGKCYIIHLSERNSTYDTRATSR